MNTYPLKSLTLVEALAIGADIVSLARARTVHPRILAALADVEAAHGALDEACRDQEDEGDPPSLASVAAPLASAKSILGRIDAVLEAHAALPSESKHAVAARHARLALFPKGTTFLRGTATAVDVHGGRLLERAREKPTAQPLRALDLGVAVRVAGAAIAELGAARRAASSAVTPEREATDTFEAVGELVVALREYARVVQAVECVTDKDLARELLAPLANRRASKRNHARVAPAGPTAPPDIHVEAEEVPPSRAA